MQKLLTIPFLLFMASSLCVAEDYLDQGAGHLSAGNYLKAVRSYELALKSKQDDAAAYKGLGTAYFGLGDLGIAYNVEMIAAAVSAFNQSLSFTTAIGLALANLQND